MYNPSLFVEDRTEVLQAFIRRNPLGVMVTCSSAGPEASHVPVVLHAQAGARGLLRFHLARANEHWKQMQAGAMVLAIFQGPEHYITPSWYPSKQAHGKVVPTWNYLAVHVQGRAKLFEGRDELIAHLRALTDQNEQAFEQPWSLDDAPKEYVEGLSKAVVGVEVSIDSMEGKWKVSQNRPEGDREGVVAGLNALGSSEGSEMARLVAQRGFK